MRDSASAAPGSGPGAVLPGEPAIQRLGNGLTVCLLENRQAPVVTTALWYRAGSRDEPEGRAGVAHFLEHMMFKGSARFGPGEVDRRIQRLGGADNAFTSPDATVYYFELAADRWTEALEIEADRMLGLTLDPRQVETERRVILEEIAMYEDDPWDSLDQRVKAELYGAHPYGRPVLGLAADLSATDGGALEAFHRRFYRPDNAVLVVAGDVGPEAFDEVASRFAGLPPGGQRRPELPPPPVGEGLRRVIQERGEAARILVALPALPAADPDTPALRILATVLAGGRTSRLYRVLVDEGQLCVTVGADLADLAAGGHLGVAAELLPGVSPELVEERILEEIEALGRGVEEGELERARQIFRADWIFGHEGIRQQALTAGLAAALFDPGFPERQLREALACGAEGLAAAASRHLRPRQGSAVGWSLPERRHGAP